MDVVSVLTYFGITPATVTPLVVVGGIGIYFVFKHTDPIRKDVRNIRERLPVVESRVTDLWESKLASSHSPRKLTDKGSEILDRSGVKELVDANKEKLLEAVRAKNATNAYDAEQATLDVMMKELPQHVSIESLKEGAFKVGATLDTILFVGGIYLRDLIFPELGFSLDDLDKSKGV